MFSAFFGHYLLDEKIITSEQLKQIFDLQDSTHLKIGTMAINEGFMTVAQVEEVHEMQLTCDKLFGALAIEADYLTKEQLTLLLNEQKQEHLLLAQILFDMDILSFDAYNAHLMAYKSSYKLSDDAMVGLESGDVACIVDAFLHFEDNAHTAFYKDYVTLFIKNQVRFINRHVCLYKSNFITKSSYDHMIRQMLYSDANYFTAIAGDSHSLTAFASMAANEKFKVFGEYPIDAIGEYMNLNNNLFVANKAGQNIDIRRDKQTHVEAPILMPTNCLYDLPLQCSCGTIHLILGQL